MFSPFWHKINGSQPLQSNSQHTKYYAIRSEKLSPVVEIKLVARSLRLVSSGHLSCRPAHSFRASHNRLRGQKSLHVKRDIIADQRVKIAQDANRIASTARILLQELAVLQNSFCAINSIPDEVLVTIFHHAIADASAGWDWGLYRDRLLVLCRTCSAWRNVALNCGVLWGHVDLSVASENLARLFLQRSKSSGLKIEWKLHTPRVAVGEIVYVYHIDRWDARINVLYTPPSQPLIVRVLKNLRPMLDLARTYMKGGGY